MKYTRMLRRYLRCSCTKLCLLAVTMVAGVFFSRLPAPHGEKHGERGGDYVFRNSFGDAPKRRANMVRPSNEDSNSRENQGVINEYPYTVDKPSSHDTVILDQIYNKHETSTTAKFKVDNSVWEYLNKTTQLKTGDLLRTISAGKSDNLAKFNFIEYENHLLQQYNTLFQIGEDEESDNEYFGFNVMESLQVAFNRRINDTRSEWCPKFYNSNYKDHVSIIISFYNVHFSVLLRNIHSIFLRTPLNLIKEIILIDDCSTLSNLGKPLSNYILLLPKCRLFRTTHPIGISRANLLGARVASGKHILFLSPYSEVQQNWLEPLLETLSQNVATVAIPVSDIISPTDYTITQYDRKYFGSISWDLTFVWKDVLVNTITDRRFTKPFASTAIFRPFAMNRDFFFHIGAFDEGIDLVDDSNIELSLRVWMCGGSVTMVPCSRVAQLTPGHRAVPVSDNSIRNRKRIAEVWMEDYKSQFYSTVDHQVTFTAFETRMLKVRHQIKAKLQCMQFDWFIQNNAPELILPAQNSLLFGQIKNFETNGCLTNADDILIGPCPHLVTSQQFNFANDFTITNIKSECLTFSEEGFYKGASISFQTCEEGDKKQKWIFEQNYPGYFLNLLQDTDKLRPLGSLRLQFWDFEFCLGLPTVVTSEGRTSGMVPEVLPCDLTDTNQYWVFTYKLHKHPFGS